MINSRLIDDLSLPARKVCQAHVEGCRRRGIELLVTATFRDSEYQTSLWNIGRVTDLHRKPVTNAKAGQSWHQYRCAWDTVPVIGGKAIWDDEGLWKEVITIGRGVGAECGADWTSFPDKPHFQKRPAGMTLATALERFRENGTIFL